MEDFIQAYSSPEKLLDPHNFTHQYDAQMNPHEAVKRLNCYARRQIVEEGLLDPALTVYEKAIELQRQRTDANKRRKRTPGFVYFIKSDSGLVKIGRTTNFEKRMKTFGVKLPFLVNVEHVFETTDIVNVEKKFHEVFADRRVDGEWFDLGDLLMSIKKGEFDDLVRKAEQQQSHPLATKGDIPFFFTEDSS